MKSDRIPSVEELVRKYADEPLAKRCRILTTCQAQRTNALRDALSRIGYFYGTRPTEPRIEERIKTIYSADLARIVNELSADDVQTLAKLAASMLLNPIDPGLFERAAAEDAAFQVKPCKQ